MCCVWSGPTNCPSFQKCTLQGAWQQVSHCPTQFQCCSDIHKQSMCILEGSQSPPVSPCQVCAICTEKGFCTETWHVETCWPQETQWANWRPKWEVHIHKNSKERFKSVLTLSPFLVLKDFGLSRLGESVYASSTGEGPLKWMPPEAIHPEKRIFSEKSGSLSLPLLCLCL